MIVAELSPNPNSRVINVLTSLKLMEMKIEISPGGMPSTVTGTPPARAPAVRRAPLDPRTGTQALQACKTETSAAPYYNISTVWRFGEMGAKGRSTSTRARAPGAQIWTQLAKLESRIAKLEGVKRHRDH